MVYGDLAPAILEWENVGAGGKHFVLPDPTIQISPKGNIFYGEFHSVAEKAGGNSGSIDDQINALIEQLNDIKNQADKKFEIWFGGGVPHPDSSTDTESNEPASDWTTEAEKALHAQDLYYDTDKSPASKGGRAWRWMAHNTNGTVAYYWEEVTDKDTIDALEKSADLQNQIDDIVSDGILDASEKISVKKEFLSLWHEIADDGGLFDKGLDDGGEFYSRDVAIACQDMTTAFDALGTYLNGSTAWSVFNGDSFKSISDANTPVWITAANISVNTDIVADTYRTKWSDYYSAKAAYLGMLAKNAQTTANEKANVFVSDSVPSQPYKLGDMWIQTANGNNVMICKVTRTGTDAGILSDWEDLSDTYDFKGIRTLLASLAEKIYDISGGYIESRGKINVYLYKDGAEMRDGNIRFDGNGVARCSQNTWTKIDNAGYTDAFTCVYGVLGSSMLTIYSSKPSSASKYDLVIRKTNWHDPFKNDDVQGNIEILMYNGSSWEMLRESTKAIIENLGDEIRTVVFGSDGKGATDASGLVTRDMFNTLFSQKLTDNKVVTESTISTWLGSNDYLTGASIKAWAENESGLVKSATLDAYVKKVSIGDGKYSLESGIVLSADQINFIGKTIINDKFWVDAKGVVYMDDANVSGTINATKGRIGRFNIGYDGLYAGSWDSSKAETISDAWFDTDNKENICYLNSSSLWLEQQVGYFSAGDMAYMMVGLGRGSDPTTKGDENNYCSSAMYVYRNMMSMDFGGAESYYPAAKIISKNAFGCDIALRVVGGLQVHGGVMEKGYSMEYTASGNVNVLDLSNGTTLLLYTSIAPKTEGHTKTYQSFFFPTLTKLRYQIGISDTATSFSVRVVIIARKDTQDYMICTQKGISGVTDAEAGILVDNNGNEWQSSHEIMGRGDVTIYSLTFTPATGYYVQLISNAD